MINYWIQIDQEDMPLEAPFDVCVNQQETALGNKFSMSDGKHQATAYSAEGCIKRLMIKRRASKCQHKHITGDAFFRFCCD